MIINRLRNPRASILPKKWRFNSSLDWETLVLNFKSFSMDDLADEILWALGFHISATWYLEEVSPYFTDVTDLELTAKPVVVDNPGQVVMDFEEEVVKKKNKYAPKKKKRLAQFHLFVGFLSSPCPESSPFLSSHSVLASVPAIIPCPLLCPLLWPLLFFVPHLLLFYCLVACWLQLHLQLFSYLVMLLFLVAKFQLFCCFFLCLVHLIFLDLYLSKHSNNLCQMSLSSAYQTALQSPFIYSRLLAYTI